MAGNQLFHAPNRAHNQAAGVVMLLLLSLYGVCVCGWDPLLPCSKTEMLAKSNKFECETCGSHQEAQRRIKIRAAPSCLILHLKRFKFIEHLRRWVC